ncbi:MAG: SIS domain-containing protein [Chthoniobacterales bacterium]|nr:SIS domain-containing protein [Chthoniobacterales bacterium]
MSKSHKAITPFAQSLQEAVDTLQSLTALEPLVVAAADTVLGALEAGGKLLFCGNGGSAADSAHIATEFTCRFLGDRRPYPGIALSVDGGLLTAIGNDYAFQEIFSRQVRAYGKPGDVLIALTSSGKSRNILSAIEEARRIGLKTIVFLGKGGGYTKGAADIEILVPGTVTARIQEAQKFLLHVLCELVEPGLKKE